ncbi:MAG TPA: SOS response-associated peptidase family protein, partial [Thermoanaerobaculia bacterium]
ILVTDANADVAPVHDRMPAILARKHHALWLGEAGAAAERDLHALLAPAPAGALRRWPVDRRVNSPENDDAGVMAPLAETGDGLLP